jgi:hypothetical protein
VERGVQRQEALFTESGAAVGGDLFDAIDLEVDWPRAIGNDVELPRAFRDLHAIETFRQQVDDRRAVQGEAVGVDQRFERGLAALEQQHDLEFVARHAAYCFRQAAHLEEQITLR